MSNKTHARSAAVCLAAGSILIGVLALGHLRADAAAPDDRSLAAAITRLPFNGVEARYDVLAISADGRTAAHVNIGKEVVLWDPTNDAALETIPADGKEVGAVALNPAGDLVAIGYADARVVVWSRRERKPVRELGGHLRAISALAFSPDGRLLASGGSDATTQVWEVETGKRVRVFDSRYGEPVGSDGGNVLALGFSGDGRALIVNEWYQGQYEPDRGTSVWDIDEGIEIFTRHVTPPNTGYFVGVGQAVGGGWLLTYTGRDGLLVERLDVCGAPPRQMPAGGYADTVAADPQGRWVAASEPEKLTFFGLSGEPQGRSVELPGKAVALAAHPDGRSVFALVVAERGYGDIDYDSAAIYRVAVPEPLTRLPALSVPAGTTHCPAAPAARALQDFRLPDRVMELPVAARLVPTRAMVATAAAGRNDQEYKPPSPPRELYFTDDGNLYVYYYAYADESISGAAKWDTHAQRPLRARFKHNLGMLSLRLRDGWATTEDGTTLTHLLTGRPLLHFKDDEMQDPRTVIADSDTGEIYRVGAGGIERYAADGRRLPDISTGGKKPLIVAARNGWLAALLDDNRVQRWQIKSGAAPKTFGPLRREGNCDFDALTLTADGRYLRTDFDCGDGGTMYWMYDFETAKWGPTYFYAAPLPARANRAVVPDDRLNRLAVLDLAKGELIARLPRHRSRDKHGAHKLLLAAISDDGRLVAGASSDGWVRVWDIDARRLLGEATLGGAVTTLTFDAPGRLLAVGREDGEVVVLRIPAVSGQ